MKYAKFLEDVELDEGVYFFRKGRSYIIEEEIEGGYMLEEESGLSMGVRDADNGILYVIVDSVIQAMN
jgi:hypothetical protein